MRVTSPLRVFARAHRPLIVFVTLLIALGCAPSQNEVVGSYRGALNGAREILVLRPDGTFSQDLTLPSGQKTNAVGSWRLKYKAVTLDRYLYFYDWNGALVEPQQAHGCIYGWHWGEVLTRDLASGYYALKKQ